MATPPTDLVHWRDSSRNPRFYFLDAYACFPLIFFTLHIRQWTFGLAVLSTLFFAILERFGFTPPVFARWLRAFIAGPQKTATPWWMNRIKD